MRLGGVIESLGEGRRSVCPTAGRGPRHRKENAGRMRGEGQTRFPSRPWASALGMPQTDQPRLLNMNSQSVCRQSGSKEVTREESRSREEPSHRRPRFTPPRATRHALPVPAAPAPIPESPPRFPSSTPPAQQHPPHSPRPPRTPQPSTLHPAGKAAAPSCLRSAWLCTATPPRSATCLTLRGGIAPRPRRRARGEPEPEGRAVAPARSGRRGRAGELGPSGWRGARS